MAKKKKEKSGKKVIIVLCILLALVIAAFVGGFAYWQHLKNTVPEVEDTLVYDFDDETQPAKLEDDPNFADIFEGDVYGFEAALKEWATNGGDVMYDKDVINVLCIGVDTRNKNTISGLTDSMMIVSINRNLGKITITSIMRDSFAYLESPEGYGSFNKINAAFPFYGIQNLVNTIESHFKIKIDGYAMINFAFFKSVIDELGGVTVEVQQYEADYINSCYNFGVEAGSEVTLNGDEALAFCRSRHCDADGDVSRTRRQRQVIIALLKKAQGISLEQATAYVKKFVPYLETGFTEAEIISYATKAVIGEWAKFKVEQVVMPSEECREAHSEEIWYWAVDYPLAANILQNKIYGYSNVVLDENRISPLDM